MRELLDSKLIKFAGIGLINTCVGMLIMFGLYNVAGCSYWVSSAANYILTSILSFVLNKTYTFKYKGDTLGSAFRFVITIASCYIVAYGFAKPVVRRLLLFSEVRIQDNIALMVGMILFTVLNYLGQRFFAFKGKSNQTK